MEGSGSKSLGGFEVWILILRTGGRLGNSFREEAVKGTYDLKDVKLEKHICGSIPIEGLNWQIGVIVGSSGSGKTSIARHLWPEAYFADLRGAL